MQDPNDGTMYQLPDGLATLIQQTADRAHRAVPLFRIGEVIKLRGGRFRVVAIGSKFIRLEGMPGTRVENDRS